MRAFFGKLRGSALVRILLCLALGLLLVIYPDAMLTWMLYILAGCLALMGCTGILTFLRAKGMASPLRTDFVSAVLLILASILLVAYPTHITGIIHILMGVLIALSGARSFVQSRDIRKRVAGAGTPLMIYSLGVMLLGALIILNPFAVQVMLFRVFGASLLVTGLGEVFWLLFYRKAMR